MSWFSNFFSQSLDGVTLVLALIVLLALIANAVLLAWLLLRRGGSELARCPRCGRTIICPHCSSEEDRKEPPPAKS